MASESINDFAIKLGVDATGVATGMAAANAIILQSQREMAKAEAVEREINLQETLKDIEAKDKALERASQKHRQRLEEDARRFAAGAGRGDMQSMTVGGRIPVSENTLRMVRAYVDDVEEANRLEREAIGLRRQLMTAEQLHTARVAEYDAMLARNILTQQEHANAVAYSTRIAQASAGGFGGAGAAITQASYAAEDFIQVLSMGGGMNMALMSASNNLSMVARSVLGTNAAMGALAGFGVPAVLIGLGMLIRYLSDTENSAEKATKALEEFRKETEHLGDLTALRQKFAAESRDIAAMQSREEVEQKITALKQEQMDLDERMAQEEMKRAGANAAYFDTLMGGQKALLDFQNQINKSIVHGSEQQKSAAVELNRLLAQAREAAIAGNEQNMLNSLRNLHDMMTRVGVPQLGIEGIDVGFMDNFKAIFNDPVLLDNLQGLFNPNLTDLQENMDQQKKIAEELISQQEHMTEERKRQLEIAQKLLEAQEQMLYVEAQAAGQATRERQQRMREELDYMRMSEAEREMKRLRDAQAAFAGIDTAFVGPQLPISEEAFAQEFMNQQLQQVQKEIEQLRKPGFASSMEKNAFDAQAKAFEQVLKAEHNRRDPQVERLDTLIEVERQLLQTIENNGVVRVVP